MERTATLEHSGVSTVLRNTYMLLSMTLGWSALTAFLGINTNFGLALYIGVIIASFATLFAISRMRNSGWGVVLVFVFTGLMGFSLGPVLQGYLKLPSGPLLIASAAATTAVMFAILSGYVLVTGKDFSFLGGFLFIGLVGLILASIIGLFFPIPAMQMTLAFIGVLIFSGYILYDTSKIIHGGEQNYVLATVQLYLDIFNLFTSLLRLFRS
jgi:modulator of FtsH protease